MVEGGIKVVAGKRRVSKYGARSTRRNLTMAFWVWRRVVLLGNMGSGEPLELPDVSGVEGVAIAVLRSQATLHAQCHPRKKAQNTL